MADTTANIDIIYTKLHRPPMTKDLVPRTHLLERFEFRRQRPLTLISAPAGYGKSTLASSWLEASECPGTWVSLDAEDSDLRFFLVYVVAAIQMLFPEACQQTQALLNAAELPPGKVLAHTLLNDLVQIETPFILVLDDYQCIHEQAVHDLLKELLHHPPATLHLVIITRHNPALPLTSLRAQGQMTEIREQDLRFSLAETLSFLQQAVAIPIDEHLAVVLEDKTEGWVTGLRLAALSIRRQEDADRLQLHLPENTRYITEYLLTEVLSQQPAVVQEYLLVTAMLDRFCAPLCEAVYLGSGRDASHMSGRDFLACLEQAGLFVIALDDQQQWFRYHHLFQKLLQYQLRNHDRQEKIVTIHKRASEWFESQELIEEALQHALAAEDMPAAIRLVAEHRHQAMNREQWARLGAWLRLFPDRIVDQYPDLLLLKAWIFQNRLRPFDIPAILEQTEALLKTMPPEAPAVKRLRGEIMVLRSYQCYNAADGQRVLSLAQDALEHLPEECFSARSLAVLLLGAGHQMTGDFTSAKAVLYQALQDDVFQNNSSHTRLLAGLCWIHWLEADLTGMQQIAKQKLTLSQTLKLPESLGIAHYFLGISHYQRNELATAEHILIEAVKSSSPFKNLNLGFSTFALALTYQAEEQAENARNAADKIVSLAIEAGNTTMLKFAQAFQAELDLRQGRLANAGAWARHYEPFPFLPATRAYLPQLTYVKVLLTQATIDSRQHAAELLKQLYNYYDGVHNTRFAIEILALQALLADARDDRAAALSILERAITLAEPGGFLRLFVDLGPEMACLLKELMNQQVATRYIGRLLNAFRHEELRTMSTVSERPGVSSASRNKSLFSREMTNRESEILVLLAQRMSNQEVADTLFISPETVKRHVMNLYKKLAVHNRREAVAKARALGILPEK